MPDYRRYRVPGGTYFFTIDVLERRTYIPMEASVYMDSTRFAREETMMACKEDCRYISGLSVSGISALAILSNRDLEVLASEEFDQHSEVGRVVVRDGDQGLPAQGRTYGVRSRLVSQWRSFLISYASARSRSRPAKGP
jgi:hypothetical protein